MVLATVITTRTWLLSPLLTIIFRKLRVLGDDVTAVFEPFPYPRVVLTNVRLAQFVVDLANTRFLAAPLCMPCDFLTCDEIIVDLRPQRIWKLRTLPLAVRNFKLFTHRTFADEWHQESRLAAFRRWRISYADWLTSLIEPPPRWTPALWQWALDYVMAYLDLDVRNPRRFARPRVYA